MKTSTHGDCVVLIDSQGMILISTAYALISIDTEGEIEDLQRFLRREIEWVITGNVKFWWNDEESCICLQSACSPPQHTIIVRIYEDEIQSLKELL